jgi:hypothetical protein
MSGMAKSSDEKYSEQETARRRDEALLRALSTPPKPHSEMKMGKRKAVTSAKSEKRHAKDKPI